MVNDFVKDKPRKPSGNVPKPNNVDQDSCPHDKHWLWSAPHNVGNGMHEQWKFCGRCHYDPKMGDVQKHFFGTLGVCECSAVIPEL